MEINIKWLDIKYYVLVIGTIIVAFLLSFILRKIMNVFIVKYSRKIKSDPTNFYFIKNSISFLIYTIGLIFIFYNVPSLKSLGTALFAGAGVLAAILGFASQKAFSNIISGIFILLFKPFRVDDIVELSTTKKGTVEEITLRHTVIRDYENRRVIIPNSMISDDTIINSSINDQRIRKFVEFGISYDSDVDTAIKIIQEEALKHPNYIDGRTKEDKKNGLPEIVVRVIGMGDFSVNLRAYVWSKDNDSAFVMTCDLYKSVKARFDKEGIEIPFPYRTIVYKKDIS